jgi:hypothetical protein
VVLDSEAKVKSLSPTKASMPQVTADNPTMRERKPRRRKRQPSDQDRAYLACVQHAHAFNILEQLEDRRMGSQEALVTCRHEVGIAEDTF